jgi:MarR family transcriptional regulator, transcriptional regulator for hemolysin
MTKSATDQPPNPAPWAPRPLTDDMSWLLARVSHALGYLFVDALAPLGLSLRTYIVLSAAAGAACVGTPRSQLALAQAVGLDKSTMVVTIDELERAGFVTRRPDPHDRRARVVALTPAGQQLLAQAEETIQRVELDALADISSDDKQVFHRLLKQLLAGRLNTKIESGSCL